VRVGVNRYRKVPLADVLADSGLWDAAEVEERDPPMAEVVGAERGHRCGCAGVGDRGSEAVAAEPEEDAPLRCAVFARYEPADGLEDDRGHVDPSAVLRLRDAR
jgi:hypothetical protein